MDPAIYYRTFRPYIRFFESVIYEGVDAKPLNFRGETGAQSSVIPMIVAFLKVPHRASMLTDHLADMRRFMPMEHRAIIEHVETLPDVRHRVDKQPFNDALDALGAFRETHLQFAVRYIASHERDPRGTGGTPYMRWLSQLIDETKAHKIV
jgi:indoleamine 2,3-dioxygenase